MPIHGGKTKTVGKYAAAEGDKGLKARKTLSRPEGKGTIKSSAYPDKKTLK